MKIKKNTMDSANYVIWCFLTLGMACLLRIVISQGIRMALEDKK